jgi:hypothetical protein
LDKPKAQSDIRTSTMRSIANQSNQRTGKNAAIAAFDEVIRHLGRDASPDMREIIKALTSTFKLHLFA